MADGILCFKVTLTLGYNFNTIQDAFYIKRVPSLFFERKWFLRIEMMHKIMHLLFLFSEVSL